MEISIHSLNNRYPEKLNLGLPQSRQMLKPGPCTAARFASTSVVGIELANLVPYSLTVLEADSFNNKNQAFYSGGSSY